MLEWLTRRPWPTMEQWQHAPQFLSQREKNIVAAASVAALIALGGIFWQTRTLLTVAVPARGGDLTEGLVGQPQYINPLFAATDTDRTLTGMMFLPLCDVDGRGAPALASSCTRDAQGRYVVTLEQRLWHDGEPITSDDVVFTFDLMRTEAVGSPWRALASRVTVGRDGSRRAIITIHEGNGFAPHILATRIIPAHRWRTVPINKLRTDELNRRPVGSGPFAMNQMITASDGSIRRLALGAFKEFLPQRPYLDSVTFLIADTDADVADFFRARQVDAFVMTDPTTRDTVKRDVAEHNIAPSVMISLFINQRAHPALKEKSVRMALARAVNRDEIISEALHGAATASRVPFPPSLLHTTNAVQPAFDPKPITALGTEPLVLATAPAPSFAAVARVIQKQLSAVGINTTIQIVDGATDPDALLNASLVLLGQDYNGGGVQAHWHSRASGLAGTNFSRYQIKEVDGLIDKLTGEPRTQERAILLKKISDRLVADVPAIYLYQPTYTYYMSATFRGITMKRVTDPVDRFAEVHDWYVHTKRVW